MLAEASRHFPNFLPSWRRLKRSQTEITSSPGRVLVKYVEIARALAVGLAPIVATPVAFVIPSKARHIDAGKLALLSLAVTTFLLFTATFSFPGGAEHFPAYADAIVQGKKLPPQIAQRDAGYPLLLVLSGYTLWHSFIGITLIQAAFAALMPLLVYWSIVRVSPVVAYYAGIASILSLAPIYFMKWIHHDQAYIFFTILIVALLANFLQTRRHAFLYLFTLAAIAASFTRPAGNLLFPALLIVSYIAVRGKLVHYFACVAIFATVAAAYQWHRYEIFDRANQPSMPSYTGQQVFYDLYINTGEFGIRLAPDEGPALKRITETLRQKLQPDVRRAVYMQASLAEWPPAFAAAHILPYTPDALIERIYEAPNYEYYELLASAESENDQFVLQASWEIARAHPLYVVQYTLRNLRHMLFQPGYAHTRYNVAGFQSIGLQFPPSCCGVAHPSATGVRERAELSYDSLAGMPDWVQQSFGQLRDSWRRHFRDSVLCTSILIVVAWITVTLRLLALAQPRLSYSGAFKAPAVNGTVASAIAASMFLLYNTLVTAAFADPDYRYYFFTELLRIMVAGYGIALVVQMLSPLAMRLAPAWHANRMGRVAADAISRVQTADLFARVFGRRPRLFTLTVLLIAGASFAWWTASVMEQTWSSRIVKGTGIPIYLVEGGKKHFVADRQMLTARGFSPSEVEILVEDALNQLPVGDPLLLPNEHLPDGMLIRGSGVETYLIGNGQRQLIPDDRTFQHHGFRREDVAQVPEDWLRGYPTGPSLPFYTGPTGEGEDIAVPPPPTDLTATTLDSSRILLKWAHPMQADVGFTVFFGGGFPDVTQGDATTREYIVGGLAPGTRQCFRVVAYNGGGGSLWSNEACATLFR